MHSNYCNYSNHGSNFITSCLLPIYLEGFKLRKKNAQECSFRSLTKELENMDHAWKKLVQQLKQRQKSVGRISCELQSIRLFMTTTLPVCYNDSFTAGISYDIFVKISVYRFEARFLEKSTLSFNIGYCGSFRCWRMRWGLWW